MVSLLFFQSSSESEFLFSVKETRFNKEKPKATVSLTRIYPSEHSFFVGLCVLGTQVESLKPCSLNKDLNTIINFKKEISF